MREFSELNLRLEQLTEDSAKSALIANYLSRVSGPDRDCALSLLNGKTPRSIATARELREWISEYEELPLWLIEESYDEVGDAAETVALLLSKEFSTGTVSLSSLIATINAVHGGDADQRRAVVRYGWGACDRVSAFYFNKIVTGSFRPAIRRAAVVKALSTLSGVEESVIAHRMLGSSSVGDLQYSALTARAEGRPVAPYPFYLPTRLTGTVSGLGEVSDWIAGWEWEGIKVQIINRNAGLSIWSEEEELLNDSFPEFQELHAELPIDTVIDAHLVSLIGDGTSSSSPIRRRVGAKRITSKLVAETPATIFAADLLELAGIDLRSRPFSERHLELERIVPASALLQSIYTISATCWEGVIEARSRARARRAAGLLLKRRSSTYGVGRSDRDFFIWKVDPFTITGVLVYAQKGQGTRGELYSDLTFAVWGDDRLAVPFAKTSSGLSAEDLATVDDFIRKNTTERYGPVRTVAPELVFEISFEGIERSKRHRSGVSVRSPRIRQFRPDISAARANTLAELRALLDIDIV